MDENEIQSMAIKFKSIYKDGFRHNYAGFFPLIIEMSKDESEYNIDYLSTNIDAVRQLVERDYFGGEKEFKGLYMPLSKLSDHINLEIARYSYYSVNDQRLKDFEKKNDTLQSELTAATNELAEAKQTVSSMQTELIAVLSIFAAIVLAFSGSINLIGSALTGMENVCLFKAAFFVLLCGFVIFNLIFLMMYIVGKITGRNIYARCKSENCTCNADGTPTCSGIRRVRKRLPYIFWTNISIILLIIADLILWICNIFCWHIPI